LVYEGSEMVDHQDCILFNLAKAYQAVHGPVCRTPQTPRFDPDPGIRGRIVAELDPASWDAFSGRNYDW